MRLKSPERIQEICACVDRYRKLHHRSPSLSEIAEAVNAARSTVHRYLCEMDEKNIISYDGRTTETTAAGKFKSGYFSDPVTGEIRCGNPAYQKEQIMEDVCLPESLFGQGRFYILRACRDSVTDVGIEVDDLVVIKKQETVSVGDIMAALDGNNGNTLKKFGGIDSETHGAILFYRNRTKYPNREIRVRELIVQGIAKHVIKAL